MSVGVSGKVLGQTKVAYVFMQGNYCITNVHVIAVETTVY
jgi:hypothetical protein